MASLTPRRRAAAADLAARDPQLPRNGAERNIGADQFLDSTAIEHAEHSFMTYGGGTGPCAWRRERILGCPGRTESREPALSGPSKTDVRL